MSSRAIFCRPDRRPWNASNVKDAPVNRIKATESGPSAMIVPLAIKWVPLERSWFATSARIRRFFFLMGSAERGWT